MKPRRDDFTQRRGAGKMRVWTWDENPRIRIRERINASNGIGYRVTFPKGVTGGAVLHSQSRDFEEAKTIARTRGRDFRQSRSTALVLGDAEKIQAAAAIRHLSDNGLLVPLDAVARQVVDATKALKPYSLSIETGTRLLAQVLSVSKHCGRPLSELVDFAARRLGSPQKTKSVAQLADEMISIKRGWLARGDLRPASFQDFEHRALKIASDIGELNLPEVTKGVIFNWLAGLKVAPRTLKNYRMVLAEMLKYATQKRYIQENPVSELTRQDVKELEGNSNAARQPSILTPAEAEKLLKAAFAAPELDLGAVVVLGLFGGIRTEELKRLRWDAVRLTEERPFVVIGHEIAKKRRIRNVPLPPNALAWLLRWERRGEAVTSHTDRNHFQKRFKKLVKAAGLTWENNAMRHSFGTYHFAMHGNSVETARILGHKQDDTVLFAHYRALASKEDGEAFFSIMPSAQGGVIPFPSAAAV